MNFAAETIPGRKLHKHTRYLPCDLITNYLYKKSKLLGWGRTDPAGNRSTAILQAVDVKVIDNTRCQKWHREHKGLEKVCPFNYLF